MRQRDVQDTIGLMMGLWSILWIIINTVRDTKRGRSSRRVSSVWALGMCIMFIALVTVEWGWKGFLCSILMSFAMLFFTVTKYGLR